MHAPTAGTPRQAAIYVRSATGETNSIEEQLRVCRAFAATHGHELREEHVFVDRGVSGLAIDRPGWSRMLREPGAPADPPIRVLVVTDLSRVARSEPRLIAHWIYHLAGLGVRIECAHGAHPQPVSGTAVGGYMLEQLEAVRTDWERNAICNRLSRGREQARLRRAGRYFSGRAPYGFLWVPEHDTPDGWHAAARTGNWLLAPATDGSSAVVHRIFTCLAGGQSLGRIAAELNESGTPAPHGAARWTRSHITRIARNPISVGDLVWSVAGPVGGSHIVRGWIADPPVTRALFDQVQLRLNRR
jgi:DNA invertase Pin-like site-specific DNA recombinase